jgi:hypothetical protein
MVACLKTFVKIKPDPIIKLKVMLDNVKLDNRKFYAKIQM